MSVDVAPDELLNKMRWLREKPVPHRYNARATTVNEYFRTNYGGDVGILWNVDTHQSIIYISCRKWGVSDYYAGVARDHADDPDYWTQIPPPPGYPDWLWDFIMQVVHLWTTTIQTRALVRLRVKLNIMRI